VLRKVVRVMANERNLIPFNERTESEQREIARQGGIASGEARRERKTMKEELLALLSEGNTQEKISLSLIQQALEGNTKAFEVIRDTIGEKPVDKVRASVSYEDRLKEVVDKDEY
jgi:hypothetical protein